MVPLPASSTMIRMTEARPGNRSSGLRPRWMGTRAARRGLVAACTLAAAGAAGLWAGGAWVAGAAAAAGAVVLILALALATRNVASVKDRYADERDRAVRDRAHRLAYWIVSAPLGAAFGLALGAAAKAIRTGHDLVVPHEKVGWLIALAWIAIALFAALPVTILAWTEPDQVSDDPS